jgi:hypothetical protein
MASDSHPSCRLIVLFGNSSDKVLSLIPTLLAGASEKMAIRDIYQQFQLRVKEYYL